MAISKPDIWAAQATQALWDTVGLRGTVKYFPDLLASPGENIKVPLWTAFTAVKRSTCTAELTTGTVTQTDKTIAMDDYYVATQLCYEEMFESPYIGDIGFRALRDIDALIDTDIIAFTGTAGATVGTAGTPLTFATISSGAAYLATENAGDKFLVVGQTGYTALVNDTKVLQAKAECCADEATAINGELGMLLGFRVIVSDQITSGTADGGGEHNLMYAREGIGFGEATRGVRPEVGYNDLYGRQYLHFHYVAGVGLLDPARVVEILS